MQKEYGKLSAEQLGEFVAFVPEILAELRQMNAKVAGLPSAQFDARLPGDFGAYSQVYELPLVEHLVLILGALDRLGEIRAMAAAPDPQEALLDLVRDADQVADKPQRTDVSNEDVLGLCYSIGRTMQSMATYGRSISSLLEDARENNNQDSLFKAIRMDRSVVGCPTAIKFIAKAQIRDNVAFFGQLRNALKGPQRKPMAALDSMRYTLLLLREMGIKDMSQRDLEILFVDRLKIYSKAPGSGKNLMAQYQVSKKIKTI